MKIETIENKKSEIDCARNFRERTEEMIERNDLVPFFSSTKLIR